jgi:hypothetical protein
MAEHAKAGRTRVEDMHTTAQNPPAPPPGWLERMRNVAAHLADVWREEATGHDQGKAGLLLHAARVLKRVLKHDEPEEEPPPKEAAPGSFANRVAQTGRDIITNERGSVPGDKFDAWVEAMREQYGETLQPPDVLGHDEPEHDRGGPDIDVGW